MMSYNTHQSECYETGTTTNVAQSPLTSHRIHYDDGWTLKTLQVRFI